MCGRFVINANKDELVEVFKIDHSQLPAFKPNFNIPPSTHIPFIYQPGNARILSSAFWGLIPSWAKDKSFASHTFNARSETLSEKPSFKNAYKSQRCLIPATGYYEWEKVIENGKTVGKQPYWIGRKDQSPLAFAGLYEHWTDPESGALLTSCTVITRDAFPEIKHIHTRMPVILPPEYYQLWLKEATEDFPMIEEEELDFYAIDKAVGSPKNNYEFAALEE
ncbi:UNVERIFIED_CONTAM: hypothetical protein GTU68_017040 [Idotea baltica]|nr:hypothetical protein [Idotea baltica]